MTRNFAKTWADPGGGGREWMASHPPLEQLTKKNIPKYNVWKNIRKYVGPKEIEKTTGDNIFP